MSQPNAELATLDELRTRLTTSIDPGARAQAEAAEALVTDFPEVEDEISGLLLAYRDKVAESQQYVPQSVELIDKRVAEINAAAERDAAALGQLNPYFERLVGGLGDVASAVRASAQNLEGTAQGFQETAQVLQGTIQHLQGNAQNLQGSVQDLHEIAQTLQDFGQFVQEFKDAVGGPRVTPVPDSSESQAPDEAPPGGQHPYGPTNGLTDQSPEEQRPEEQGPDDQYKS